jgi:hypothetical protein
MSWQQGPPGGDQPPPPPNYPPPGYGYGQPSPGYNGLAIASMILGIMWLYGVGAILAVIFALIAKRQIRERREKGGAMATAGLVLGIIGIAGIVLIVVLIVAFGDDVEDDDFFDESRRSPAAVVWVSPDPLVAPPSVVVVPARP